MRKNDGVKKVFLHARPFLKNVADLKKIVNFLREKKIEISATADAQKYFSEKMPPANFSERFDAGILFGGDGTILGAVQKMRDFSTPIFSISAGNLGFLTEFLPDDFEKNFDLFLEKKLKIDERALLKIEIQNQKKSFLALNEAVVGQRGNFRMAEIRAEIDGKCLTIYRADGVIVATPTGSTAYNLSAGGPLVHPAFSAMILTPIAPHSFTQKPLILPREKTIFLRESRKNSAPLALAIDGQKIIPLEKNDEISIKIADEKMRFLRRPEEHFFKTIRRKLFWGAGNSEKCEI